MFSELIILQQLYFFNCFMTTKLGNFDIFSGMYDAGLNASKLYNYVA